MKDRQNGFPSGGSTTDGATWVVEGFISKSKKTMELICSLSLNILRTQRDSSVLAIICQHSYTPSYVSYVP
ncbi:hypothetical protein JTB14_015658 [Gonioctena quinquepunctata]|nr:hypothetical protein JTB14_015658 [Gonioctena quinquepunctata]